MKYPSYLKSSLDLLPHAERKSVIHALEKLEIYERNLPYSQSKFVKLVGTDKYLYKVSRKYRAVLEIKDKEINLIDIVHHDKIKLVIKRGREI